MIWNWYLVPLTLLCASLASFMWGMQQFFSKPSGDNFGMKLIRAVSSIFAAIHLVAILLTADASASRSLVASSIYLAALGLFFWAIQTNSRSTFSAAFSTDVPLRLVKEGPYRWIRHPFYCAYLLTWSAGFVATGHLWLLPTVAVMVGVYLKAALLEEEKFAQSPLAQAYQEYQESAGRFLPKLPGNWITFLRTGLHH